MTAEPSGKGTASPIPQTNLKRNFLRTWFGRGPRPHGDTIVDRRVSPLELLYDLVYVAVISQAGQHLAEHVSSSGLAEFAVIFALTWIAWTNGSLYLETHGRNDGRTRTHIFVQIGILAILAVFAVDAGGDGGAGFATAFAAFLAQMTWLWYDAGRQDVGARSVYRSPTNRYVAVMGVSAFVMLVSATLPSHPRLVVWAVFAIGWTVLLLFLARGRIGLALPPTESLLERFGLFTIIVLGEVVFGVVDGLSQSHDLTTIATGMIALVVGFGFWWVYFDVVGGRLPKSDGRAIANWILSHLPTQFSIAAAGAGMVSLVEHAHDATTPAPTSWLLAGAVAFGMVALTVTSRALAEAPTLGAALRPLWVAMVGGAAVTLLIGWARPAPWLLALLLVVVLGLVWSVAVRGFVRAGVWTEERPAART